MPFREIIARYQRFNRARLLKIDTDGYDAAVIHSCTEFLVAARPVVFFEYDPALLPAGNEPDAVFSDLKNCGYRTIVVHDNYGRYRGYVEIGDLAGVKRLLDGTGEGGNALYADIAAFHGSDEAMAHEFSETERLRASALSPSC